MHDSVKQCGIKLGFQAWRGTSSNPLVYVHRYWRVSLHKWEKLNKHFSGSWEKCAKSSKLPQVIAHKSAFEKTTRSKLEKKRKLSVDVEMGGSELRGPPSLLISCFKWNTVGGWVVGKKKSAWHEEDVDTLFITVHHVSSLDMWLTGERGCEGVKEIVS